VGIDSTHPLYAENIAKWRRCRDAYEGEDAVKAGGETYLPKLSPAQPAAEYSAYLMRASYYEVFGRTVDGFVGAIARKPHEYHLPKLMEPLRSNVTGDGVGLDEFVRVMCRENMICGRLGVFVDIMDETGRAFLTAYDAESVINWGSDFVNVMETVYEPDPRDPLATVEVTQIRQFHLVGGVYTVTTWRKRKVEGQRGEKWVATDSRTPIMVGRTMSVLPWFWCSTLGVTPQITKPPLLGLVNVAMSHFRSSADLEHGRHFAGRPTLCITGADPEQTIKVGGNSAITLSNPQAKVFYAEFTGQGLLSLENALASKERQIAAMGAAAFSKGDARSEPVVTAQVRASGETSVLGMVVAAVQETLTAALAFAAAWMNVPGDVAVTLNHDFIQEGLDPQTIMGLLAALQSGTIDLTTFLYALDQADMLPPGQDYAEMAKKQQAGFDARLAATAGKPAQGAPGTPSGGAPQPRGNE